MSVCNVVCLLLLCWKRYTGENVMTVQRSLQANDDTRRRFCFSYYKRSRESRYYNLPSLNTTLWKSPRALNFLFNYYCVLFCSVEFSSANERYSIHKHRLKLQIAKNNVHHLSEIAGWSSAIQLHLTDIHIQNILKYSCPNVYHVILCLYFFFLKK